MRSSSTRRFRRRSFAAVADHWSVPRLQARDDFFGNHVRCALTARELVWATQSRRLFELAAAPLFVDDPSPPLVLANTSETRCLIPGLARAEGVPSQWRAELLERVLVASGPPFAAFRSSGDAAEWTWAGATWSSDLIDAALDAVENHPTWVRESPALAKQVVRVSASFIERIAPIDVYIDKGYARLRLRRPPPGSRVRALDTVLRLEDEAAPTLEERRTMLESRIREIDLALGAGVDDVDVQ
jgi:hypothetical protein